MDIDPRLQCVDTSRHELVFGLKRGALGVEKGDEAVSARPIARLRQRQGICRVRLRVGEDTRAFNGPSIGNKGSIRFGQGGQDRAFISRKGRSRHRIGGVDLGQQLRIGKNGP